MWHCLLHMRRHQVSVACLICVALDRGMVRKDFADVGYPIYIFL